jgi:hypothetical protein
VLRREAALAGDERQRELTERGRRHHIDMSAPFFARVPRSASGNGRDWANPKKKFSRRQE